MKSRPDTNELSDEQIRRRVRIILLLDAAEHVGLTPLPILRLHAFAYLSNVLSQVWKLEPIDGKILKRRGGPFYQNLQHDIDRMVGQGMLIATQVSHIKDDFGRWHLEGAYALNYEICRDLIRVLDNFEDEVQHKNFIKELAFSLSAIDIDEFDKAMLEDATYSNSLSGQNNVIDFAEWQNRNFSTNAANNFSKYTKEGDMTSPGKKLHLYVRHLYRRTHVAG